MLLQNHMSRKYWFFVFLLGNLLLACSHNEPRKPVSLKSSSVFEKTIELNKRNLERENAIIEAYIKQDSLYQYNSTKKGFWFAYKKRNENGANPVKGDLVVFSQEIKSLSNEILHSKEELGLQDYVVDKEHIINGIQEGIKLMRLGEEIKFIFSSYVAYSTSGDKTKKIGVHEPIINTIELLNIKNQNNEH